MLGNIAVKYYNMGYNCSQCIIKAANEKYKLRLSEECIKMCMGVNNGLGIGSVCSVLTACIMVLSIQFPDNIKSKRMEMITEFENKNNGINCSKIKKYDCTDIIKASCDILEELMY